MGVDRGHRAGSPDDGGWDLDDDGWSDTYRGADDDSPWADAELDGRVRQRLATLVPLRHEAFDRWDEMQPRMIRARRRRQAARALAGSVLVAAAALAGLRGADRWVADDSSMVQAADPGELDAHSPTPLVAVGVATSTIAPDDATATPASGDDSGDGTPEEGSAPGEGPGSDDPAAGPEGGPPAGSPGSMTGSSSVPVNGGSAASSASIPPPTSSIPATGPSPSNPTSGGTPAGAPQSSATTRPATSSGAAATAAVLTVRDLGTVDVTVGGSEIRLVAVHSGAAVTFQVHDSGPEKIEITFRSGGEEHKLVATARNGNPVTSVVDADD